MSISPTLWGLVERYSPSGLEKPAVDFLLRRMGDLGYTQAFRDEVGNGVGVMGDGPQDIVLLGHIDTVPGEISVHQEGDLLYGRGSVDAKGPLAAFVDAVAQVGAVPGYRLVVIAAIDEERDSIGAQHVVDQYHPLAAIIGEPSGWDRITLGYKGATRLRLTVRRSSQHSAGQGPTASEVAVELWHKLRAWVMHLNQGVERPFDQVLATLHDMHSESDGLIQIATLDLGFRLPVILPPEQFHEELRAVVAGGEITLEPAAFPIAAYRSDKNNPLVRSFLRSIRAAGGQPRFVLKTGTADMNIVGPAWNCPILAYGPGDSNLDHTPQEHLSLGEYERSVEVLVDALTQMTLADPGRAE